ncbi:hypothetical protein HZ994_14255 [Akkermansiaceae bacterium]|nr:hypothetical protein HZ994_14255 [Akkermansiaceae bacterium]
MAISDAGGYLDKPYNIIPAHPADPNADNGLSLDLKHFEQGGSVSHATERIGFIGAAD